MRYQERKSSRGRVVDCHLLLAGMDMTVALMWMDFHSVMVVGQAEVCTRVDLAVDRSCSRRMLRSRRMA